MQLILSSSMGCFWRPLSPPLCSIPEGWLHHVEFTIWCHPSDAGSDTGRNSLAVKNYCIL